MNKYPLLTLAGIAMATSAAHASHHGGRDGAAKKPMNIIYIMCDDHSYQTISAYDQRLAQTPNIDWIAQHGTRFTESFVANSLSGPSRACLLTGKHSHKNGFTDNTRTFDGSQQTFPKLLQQAGYETCVVGKWHLTSDPTGFDYWDILTGQGDYYNPTFIDNGKTVKRQGYVTNIITDLAIDWMSNKRDKSKPFCLLLHHKAPHRVWSPDTCDLDLYNDVAYPLPDNFYDNYEGRLAAQKQEMSIIKDMDVVYDLKMADHENEIHSPNKTLEEWGRANYMRVIHSVDRNVGRVIQYLKDNDMLDNTMIVYTSDQGFYMGEHGWFDKRFMYEESFRTPLLVYLPGGRHGDVDAMVQNIDHAPTFLELAGAEVPADIQGESYLPLLQGKKPRDWRRSLYYHYYEYPAEHSVCKHYGVRTKRYALIHFYDDIDTWELYDLKKDPEQMHNIYGQPGTEKITKQLREELHRLQEQYDDPIRFTLSDN